MRKGRRGVFDFAVNVLEIIIIKVNEEFSMNVKSLRLRKPISVVLTLVLMLSVFCFGNYFNNTEAEAANNFIITAKYVPRL